MNPRALLPVLAIFFCFKVSAQGLPVLKAEASWWDMGGTKPLSPYDSFTYVHSHGRNSTPMPMTWDNTGSVNGTTDLVGFYRFDSCLQYRINSAVYEPYRYRTQTFDANGNLTGFFIQGYDKATASWEPFYKIFFFNNTDSTLAARKVVTYNKVTATWDSTSYQTYTYLPGKLKSSTIGRGWDNVSSSWKINGVDSSDYDANNNLIRFRSFSVSGSTTTETVRQLYVYNTGNQCTSDTVYSSGNPRANSYSHSSAGMLLEWLQYLNNDTSGKFVHYYDANNNLVGRRQYSFNKTAHVFAPLDTLTVTYNSNNQINYWRNNSQYYHKFYYGPVTFHVAAVKDANHMQLYPVPAVAYVNLEAELGAQQDISIMITDMTGRCVKQFKENAAGHYKKFIPLMELPAGTYTITLSGRETTSRQINVIH